MKKLLVLLFLMVLGTGAYAQKSYVTIYVDGLHYDYHQENYVQDFWLTGDIPSDMKKVYKEEYIGNILNQLAEKGFEVEFMTGSGISSSERVLFLLSKKKNSNSTAIQHISTDDEEEAREVARYNLQGIPVNKDERGIQIVVYSNYTTKTIIVE